MERSLIFFDVDGTIVDGEFHVPDSAAAAIRAARKNGHICVVNTGRPFSHIEPAVKEIGFDGYICSCGQHILLGGGSVFRRSLPTEVCQEILRLARAGGLDVVLEDEDGIWFDRTRPMRPEVLATYTHFAARGFDVTRPVDRPDLRFDKFCVFTNPDSDPAVLLDYIREYCTVIHREGDLLEFVVKGCSKETGIRTVMERTGILPENCYAIGDSANDIGMLKAAGHSAAMGNATPQAKEAADFVTEDNSHNGAAAAIERFLED